MRTPSQTVGPFLHIGLLGLLRHASSCPPGSPGALRVSGLVLDGAGEAVTDALVEVWHPDVGFGRSDTRDGGRFALRDRASRRAGAQAPHLEVAVFARGLLKQVVTRMYFPDEVEANAADAVLSAVEPERRATLVAVPEGADELRFDIRLQGRRRDGVLRAVTLEAVLVPPALRAAVSDRAWVEAMLEAERALANAEALAGVIPAHAAGPIAEACRVDRIDVEAVLEAGRAVGRTRPSRSCARCATRSAARRPTYVHYGATSQDIVDSAAMLVARNAVGADRRGARRRSPRRAPGSRRRTATRRRRRGRCSSRRCRPRSG